MGQTVHKQIQEQVILLSRFYVIGAKMEPGVQGPDCPLSNEFEYLNLSDGTAGSTPAAATDDVQDDEGATGVVVYNSDGVSSHMLVFNVGSSGRFSCVGECASAGDHRVFAQSPIHAVTLGPKPDGCFV